MGWECPRCHRCYSPSTAACSMCVPDKAGEPGRIDLREQLDRQDHQQPRDPYTQVYCTCQSGIGKCPVHRKGQ